MKFKDLVELYTLLSYLSLSDNNDFDFGITDDDELWVLINSKYFVFNETKRKEGND